MTKTDKTEVAAAEPVADDSASAGVAVASRPIDPFASLGWPFTNDLWTSIFPAMRREVAPLAGEQRIKVEQFRENGDFVIRAEIPGIDPDKDIQVDIENDTVLISAHREHRSEVEDGHSYRSEFSYGSFHRSLPLPDGTDADDISANYEDGILEVRVPVVEPAPRRKVAVNRPS